MKHENQSNGGIPRWSRPWAAGWTAMSDISRIEVDHQRSRRSTHAHARHLRAVGLAMVAIATVVSASAVVWL
mgnify:CR=1 FL=1